jgi:hypothetical protein
MSNQLENSPTRPVDYARSVFINCPFDPQYRPLFQGIVFVVEECGFIARCALEVEDSGEVRVNKIINIIRSCALGIHDISRTELNDEGLPRFNMPYEFGLFMGCSIFGKSRHKNKKALVLDRDRYRFGRFMSDIAGQDIQNHDDDVGQVIRKVRNWLAAHDRDLRLPGGDVIARRFDEFRVELPQICKFLQLSEMDLDNFRDFHNCVSTWLVDHAGSGKTAR